MTELELDLDSDTYELLLNIPSSISQTNTFIQYILNTINNNIINSDVNYSPSNTTISYIYEDLEYDLHEYLNIITDNYTTSKKVSFKSCKEINEKLCCNPIRIKKNDEILGEECLICCDNYKIYEYKRILPKCSHIFHKKCIDKWFKKNSTCPICRHDYITVESS